MKTAKTTEEAPFKKGQQEQKGFFRKALSNFLEIHNHRYFRGTFCLLIIFHILTLFSPVTDFSVPVPEGLSRLFELTRNYWPLPTFDMSGEKQIFIRNIVFKFIEILVLLLYTIDLIPKIFLWKKPLWWKLINVFVVTIMVLQVPINMIGFQEAGMNSHRLKLRICSVSLSFLLLCEILSIREQDAMKKMKHKRMLNTDLRSSELAREKQKDYKVYSWLEIVKHDKPGDCWVVIHGKVYDLSNFVDKHPGGPMIYDGCGGDCTPMWESYHPLAATKKGPPAEYLIGEVRDYHDFYSWDGDFYNTLKKRVEEKIPRSRRQNDWRLIMKGVVLVIGYFYSTYNFLYYYDLKWTVIYSFFAGQVGVNVMHDGNHMAWTSNKLLSQIAGYALELTGSTAVVYRRSHNFGHHGCVNHYELDRAFDTTYPLLRLHHLQTRMPMHKYQHFYVWLLYGTVNFGDLFGTFDELFWLSNYPTRRGHLTKTSYYSHAMVKLTWFIVAFLMPLMRFGFYDMFPIFFFYFFAFSYNYVFFFAVNHWTDQADQVDNSTLQTNWGVLQVQNSSNFALDSTLWTNLSGGLNHQIEHHLFPQFAHTRLPEIKDIVQDECKKRGIRYFTFKSFWTALRGHYRLLKLLSTPESYQPLKLLD